MFAATALAARIDRAEARLSAAFAGAHRGPPEALVLPVGGGLATLTGPGSPVNKLIGLGFDGPIDGAELDAVERSWDARGETVRVELSTLAPPAVAGQLAERGYRLVGFENVLGLTLGQRRAKLRRFTHPAPLAEPRATPVASERVSQVSVAVAGGEPAWRAVAVEGFATPSPEDGPVEIPRSAVEQVMDDLLRTPGFLRFAARLDGQLAGIGSMRIDDGIAQLAGAATLPAFRRRGVQTALLAARLEVCMALHVKDAACRVARSAGTRLVPPVRAERGSA